MDGRLIIALFVSILGQMPSVRAASESCPASFIGLSAEDLRKCVGRLETDVDNLKKQGLSLSVRAVGLIDAEGAVKRFSGAQKIVVEKMSGAAGTYKIQYVKKEGDPDEDPVVLAGSASQSASVIAYVANSNALGFTVKGKNADGIEDKVAFWFVVIR